MLRSSANSDEVITMVKPCSSLSFFSKSKTSFLAPTSMPRVRFADQKQFGVLGQRPEPDRPFAGCLRTSCPPLLEGGAANIQIVDHGLGMPADAPGIHKFGEAQVDEKLVVNLHAGENRVELDGIVQEQSDTLAVLADKGQPATRAPLGFSAPGDVLQKMTSPRAG